MAELPMRTGGLTDIGLCVGDLWVVVASLGRLSRVVGADVWIQGVRIP